MSDPALELRPALKDWIKADTEVVAAFGAREVKVFAVLPTANTAMPYVVIAGMFVEDQQADCYNAAIVNLQLDVWSLTTPAGFTEAERIAGAVKASLTRAANDGNSPALMLASHRVKFVENSSTQYLTDPSDGKTVHAVIQSRLTIDPT
jgi:hypothetical protein